MPFGKWAATSGRVTSSAPVEAEEALRQLRERCLPDTAAEDDSPTLILPPGVILTSKITDDAESHEEPSTS